MTEINFPHPLHLARKVRAFTANFTSRVATQLQYDHTQLSRFDFLIQ
jgi:hypothetical protein